jgi:uncharacterized protein (TIGR03382 family)
MFLAALSLTYLPSDGSPLVLGAGGDLNNDGFADFVVAAPTWGPNAGSPGAGIVRVYLGNATGAAAGPVVQGDPGDRLGHEVQIVPDLDGDLFDDLLLGYPFALPVPGMEVWAGTATGLSAASTAFVSGTTGAFTGGEFAAGDINGDGLGDFALGSPEADSATVVDIGNVTVFVGVTADLPLTLRSMDGTHLLSHFGEAIAMGDFDGDGFDDLVTSSSSQLPSTDGLHIWYGSVNGLSPNATRFPGVRPTHLEAGDVDGDGADDLVLFDGEMLSVAYGGVVGLTAPVDVYPLADPLFPSVRDEAVPLGVVDYNGDGADDILLGDAASSRVRVFAGRPAGPSTFFLLEGTGGFGYAVQGAGDVDDDGFEDFLVLSDTDARVELFLGRADADGDGDGPATDCDDTDPYRDSLDRDGDGMTSCDGDCADLDPTLTVGVLWYEDRDRDGFGAGVSAVCIPPSATAVPNGDDCDDADPASYPGVTWYADADGDGYGDPGSPTDCSPAAPTDVLDASDCDDTDVDAFPGVVWYTDADGDGFGLTSTAMDCARSAPSDVRQDGDCDDDDPQAVPDAVFYTDADGDGFGDDGLSWDCARNDPSDVLVGGDCDDGNAEYRPDLTWYADADGDGYGDPDAASVCAPVEPTDVLDGTDCNDRNPEITPEIVWYPDVDADGFGDAGHPGFPCEPDDPTDVLDNTDCDDQRALVFPGALDRVGNGVDEDCDGEDRTFSGGDDSGGCSTAPGTPWLAGLGLLALLFRRR